MKSTLTRMILGPIIPDYAGAEDVGLTVEQSQAMKLKGSKLVEPGEAATPPITEEPTQ